MEALRISYGRESTQEDAQRVAEEIVCAVQKIRTLSGRATHAVI